MRAGERLGLLGPNGAGKTTTLLMLLGAITPDAGTIEIGGHRLPRHRSAAMSQVGFVAGYLPLPDRLKVREALAVFAGLYGLQGHAARAAIADALERFRITGLADRPCEQLSSGQRTLVGIVKAVLHRPRLLVLDEPTASLDPDARVGICCRVAAQQLGLPAALTTVSQETSLSADPLRQRRPAGPARAKGRPGAAAGR